MKIESASVQEIIDLRVKKALSGDWDTAEAARARAIKAYRQPYKIFWEPSIRTALWCLWEDMKFLLLAIKFKFFK